jgi:hypothetical protein
MNPLQHRGLFSFELIGLFNVVEQQNIKVLSSQETLSLYFADAPLYSDTFTYEKRGYLDSRLMFTNGEVEFSSNNITNLKTSSITGGGGGGPNGSISD